MVRLSFGLILFAGLRFPAVAQNAETPQAPAETPGAQAAPGASAPETSTGDAAAPEQGAPPQAAPPSAQAVAANEAFEALVDQWNGLIEQLKQLQQKRDAAEGAARAAAEAEMADLRKQTSALVDKIAEAGLAAYQADPNAFNRVNATLLAIAQFHVIGDQHGDGGDQYEKALKLSKALIDLGAGDKWPQLYLLAGVSAYNVGELELADAYLNKVEQAGMFANVPPPSGGEPPAVKLVQDAQQYLKGLAAHREHWEAEKKIREAEAKADDLPRVKLTTSKGDIVIELFENEAPQSVANFITLVKKGFYDGVTFHRVLPLFMAQGGDPQGTGGGGPGYNIPDEQELPKARRHFRGSLSMANTGQPNSGGSQFFLTFVPTSYLDGRHAVFGRVIEGMDVAASLKRRDPDPRAPGPKPTPDKILKAEVLRDRGHQYKFEQLPE